MALEAVAENEVDVGSLRQDQVGVGVEPAGAAVEAAENGHEGEQDREEGEDEIFAVHAPEESLGFGWKTQVEEDVEFVAEDPAYKDRELPLHAAIEAVGWDHARECHSEDVGNGYTYQGDEPALEEAEFYDL